MKSYNFSLRNNAPYPSKPPIVLGESYMDEGVLKANTKIWNRTEGPEFPLEVCEVDNVLVHKLGFVSRTGEDFLPSTVLNNVSTETIVQDSRNLPIIEINEPCFLFRKPGENNYGHWLLEILPRIYLYRRLPEWSRPKLIVAKFPLATLELRVETLVMAGVTREDIILQGDEILRIKKLFFTSPFSVHSHAHAGFVFDFLQDWSAPYRQTSSGRKLFLPRPEGAKRQAVNQAEVEAFFTERGFESVAPETLGVKEQISLFSEAEIIAGPIGAAFTNLLWSNSGAQALTFMPASAREHFFWDICCHRHQTYICQICKTVDENQNPHTDYVVDMAILSQAADRILAAVA